MHGWKKVRAFLLRRLGNPTRPKPKARAKRERKPKRARQGERRGKPRTDASSLYYHRLAALIEGRPQHSVPRTLAKVVPTQEQRRSLAIEVRRLRLWAEVLESVRRGEDLGRALVQFARATATSKTIELSRPLLESLAAHGPCREEAIIARAALATKVELRQFAAELLATVPLDACLRLASREFFAVAYWSNDTRVQEGAERLLEAAPGVFTADDFVGLFEAAFAARDYSVADRALRRAEALDNVETRRSEAAQLLAWYRRWMDAASQPRQVEVGAPGRVPFAVLGYQQPDLQKTSSNLGDYTQTVAALGHLVRHQNVRLHGDPALVDPVSSLRARVRPERLLDGPAADVELYLVHRDASSLDALPPGTWMLAFGWYMSAIFDQVYDFPFHPNLRPIFVSFHVNRRQFLTPEAVRYLKDHGPVGCRDWATTYLLLSAGVEAFFSGCVTTTLDTLFPSTLGEGARPSSDAPRTLFVDASSAPDGAATFRQETREVKTRSFAENLSEVVNTLQWYASFERIVTSRLHTYLPARALGLAVDFEAKRPSDIRFDGLIDIADRDFESLRHGLLDKLAAVTELILAQASEEAVYARWAELCAEDVARAKARLQAPAKLPARATFDIEGEAARILAGRVDIPRSSHDCEGAEVRIEVSMDGNLRHQLAVVLDALEAHSRRPLHLFLLSRGYSRADHERMARWFPRVSFSWLPCDGVDYGDNVNLLKHLTVATMDRVLLPKLLPEVDRIIHLDLDTLPCDDIGKLYDVDLEGTPLAARSVLWERTSSGVGYIFSQLQRLPPEKASEFLRTSLQRHGYDFTSFSAGVMVLDLARLRQDEFCETFIVHLEEYGLNDQQLLNLYTGPNRAVLEPRWNAFPRQELVTNPAILHWAGPAKPWNPEYVRFKEDWQSAEQRLAARVARTEGSG